MTQRNGVRYEAFLLPEEDRVAQEIGVELANQLQLWDSRHKKFVKPVNGRVPRYALAKYAIQQLFRTHGYDGDLVSPDEKLRIQMRKRRIL